MEENKQLADEMIINSLKAVGKETLAFAYDKEKRRFNYVTAQEILDLIHRLKDDYSNLKERYVKVLDLNEKVITEQKTEIERLKTEFKSDYKNSWRNKFFTALEENAELQKQVDKLKAENTELYKEHTTLIAGSILQKEQVKKDTAKEIFTELLKDENVHIDVRLDQWGETYNVACVDFDTIEELAKERYDVEVE